MRFNLRFTRAAAGILALVVAGLLIGCGSEIANDWDPLTPSQARHRFGDGSHADYLAADQFDFSGCTRCHGDQLTGLELGDPADPVRSCTECHRNDSHIIAFDSTSQHAQWMMDNGYAWDQCYDCHKPYEGASTGPDLAFGGTCASTNCHPAGIGPEACNTCHGEFDGDSAVLEDWAPDSGAHTAHLTVATERFAAITCEACHSQPNRVRREGHFNDNTPGEVEVNFHGPANAGGFQPEWDQTTGTCSNVYCHFGQEMDWQATPGYSCNSCHAYPPAGGHPGDIHCSACHGSVVGPDNITFIAPGLHVNGAIDFN